MNNKMLDAEALGGTAFDFTEDEVAIALLHLLIDLGEVSSEVSLQTHKLIVLGPSEDTEGKYVLYVEEKFDPES